MSAYLDDLIIFSETFEEHIDHLRAILTRLKEAGLTAKPQKCKLGTDYCSYLGHVIGGDIFRPEKDKVKAVKNFSSTLKEEGSEIILGPSRILLCFNHSSAYRPDKKSAPVTVKWNSLCVGAFNTLKESLCQPPLLNSPDFNREFILQTDASKRGTGAVLSQLDERGQEHPVAFFSRKLLPREERYSTIEK